MAQHLDHAVDRGAHRNRLRAVPVRPGDAAHHGTSGRILVCCGAFSHPPSEGGTAGSSSVRVAAKLCARRRRSKRATYKGPGGQPALL